MPWLVRWEENLLENKAKDFSQSSIRPTQRLDVRGEDHVERRTTFSPYNTFWHVAAPLCVRPDPCSATTWLRAINVAIPNNRSLASALPQTPPRAATQRSAQLRGRALMQMPSPPGPRCWVAELKCRVAGEPGGCRADRGAGKHGTLPAPSSVANARSAGRHGTASDVPRPPATYKGHLLVKERHLAPTVELREDQRAGVVE
jgi:hypothetical protein